MKNPILKNRTFLILAGIAVLAALAGGYSWYQSSAQAAATATEPALQTSKVRTGDLMVSATGSGNVLPSAQVDLGFRTSGIVAEVDVVAGQTVKKGDVLARLEDQTQQLAFRQAEANLNALFTPAGLATYQIDMATAQDSYDTALTTLQYLISPDVYYWETKLSQAKAAVAAAVSEADKTAAQKMVISAENNLKAAQGKYSFDYLPYYFTATWIDEITEEEMIEVIPPTPNDINMARATLERARLSLTDAQAAYDLVVSGDPDALEGSLSAADGTSLAKIKTEYLAYESARLSLEEARLIAPFDGVVVSFSLVPGQSVTSSPVMTMVALDELKVKFYMDETDLAGLSVGNKTVYTLDAYPETSLNGEVTMIESVLQVIDGTPLVVVWGSLDEEPTITLLAGMTVEAEVIAGEAKNALIIPVQALRELAPGSYAVFVVQPDGSLKLTPVEIGLRDFANAEILSGLKTGDVVSTGTVETK